MYGAPYKMYGASYILYVAANTCMVRAVLYCTVLRAFSHFHAIYRCFPYNSARNSYFPLHLCAGPVGDSGAQINQPTGALVQTSTSVGTLVPAGHQHGLGARDPIQLFDWIFSCTVLISLFFNSCTAREFLYQKCQTRCFRPLQADTAVRARTQLKTSQLAGSVLLHPNHPRSS